MLSQKYNKNKYNPIIENKLGLICERFKLEGSNIKRPTFGGKGRYIISVRIIKSYSNNYYLIQCPKNYKNLEINKNYYAEYHLLKVCEENTWKELLDILNN
jgi:hypothetical protein